MILTKQYYEYRYNGQVQRLGDEHAPVVLHCEQKGAARLTCERFAPVETITGIELAPVPASDADAIRWLQALIWPEHRDRASRFMKAAGLLRKRPPRIIAGNAAEILPDLLRSVSRDAALCVYHSYTLNQCTQAIRDNILASLLSSRHPRAFYRIGLEWYSGQAMPHLELFTYDGGTMTHELLAYCESHGRDIDWRMSPAP